MKINNPALLKTKKERMKKSNNVLVIESLSVEPKNNGHFIRLIAKLNAKVEFYCSENGNHFRSLLIESKGEGISEIEALRQAIQNFIDGKFDSKHKFNDRHTQSIVCKAIHHIEIKVNEPFKSLFEQIFNSSNWEIPKHQLTTTNSQHEEN